MGVAGLVILALELVVPGGIFLWLGISAVVTGMVSALVTVSWPLPFLIFGVLAVASVAIWVRIRPHGTPSDRPFLNRRANRYVGQEVVLVLGALHEALALEADAAHHDHRLIGVPAVAEDVGVLAEHHVDVRAEATALVLLEPDEPDQRRAA